MLDLHAAAADMGVALPASVLDLLRGGDEALAHARRVYERARAGDAHRLPLGACVLDAPLRPGKLITLARNYHEHVAEHGLTHTGKVPSASIKATSSLTGPYDDIARPAAERELDYETELAVVIGRRCKNVPQSRAYDVIAGYTVLSDIVARQVLKIERAAGNQFLGKMFDSFGPLGPWLVTKDEIEDPMNLTISTRVNGELRQHGNTGRMIWKIPQLVAYFSQATLEPGDIISTGTPAGVAAGRKPHESRWFLRPGDVIECEVEGVGRLRNRIVEDDSGPASWDWTA
ncbi:MAG TPA: fumarylacetoacetate hydrolase family protein [Burkholderiales bacterium]|nr:fumarylacetoacetate hydrolase family protein [Burkholderiales bacterium]